MAAHTGMVIIQSIAVPAAQKDNTASLVWSPGQVERRPNETCKDKNATSLPAMLQNGWLHDDK
jgi:hypothetical protein